MSSIVNHFSTLTFPCLNSTVHYLTIEAILIALWAGILAIAFKGYDHNIQKILFTQKVQIRIPSRSGRVRGIRVQYSSIVGFILGSWFITQAIVFLQAFSGNDKLWPHGDAIIFSLMEFMVTGTCVFFFLMTMISIIYARDYDEARKVLKGK